MDKTLVIISSLGLIGFIYWFFLGKRKPTKLPLISKSPFPVVTLRFADSPRRQTGNAHSYPYRPYRLPGRIRHPRSQNQKNTAAKYPVTFTVTITKPGRYEFHCGMNMYHGQIIAN